MSYLTAGEQEVRAWTIEKGTKAPQAAGKIHTDFERGFIRAEVIAFDDLGCESIKRMTVENFPLTVAIDSQGNDLFRTGRAEYRRIDPAESGN